MSGLVRDARGRKHKRGCRSWAAPHDSTDIAQPPEPVVMQRENERSRWLLIAGTSMTTPAGHRGRHP